MGERGREGWEGRRGVFSRLGVQTPGWSQPLDSWRGNNFMLKHLDIYLYIYNNITICLQIVILVLLNVILPRTKHAFMKTKTQQIGISKLSIFFISAGRYMSKVGSEKLFLGVLFLSLCCRSLSV